jgi:hypothetical protein
MELSFNSPYALIAWFLIKYRDNFNFECALIIQVSVILFSYANYVSYIYLYLKPYDINGRITSEDAID